VNNLADKILELLNRSESDPLFVEFQAELDLRSSPIFKYQEGDRRLAWYSFTDLGVSMYSTDERFFTSHFHIAPIELKNGAKTLPYANPLPFGIPQGSCRADVHRILGRPFQINNPCGSAKCEYKSESYVIESGHVVFWYSLAGEQLDELRVMYSPTVAATET
jgi:hypothetical protein